MLQEYSTGQTWAMTYNSRVVSGVSLVGRVGPLL